MPRRGQRKPKVLPGDPSDAHGLSAWLLRYLEDIRARHFSAQTLVAREESLRLFLVWCYERGLSRPTAITRPILQRYQRHLFHYRRENGKPLALRTQHHRLVAIRAFFKWLTRENVILSNPGSELDLPRLVKRMPKHVLTAQEAEAILALPDLTDPLGVRDRAILEMFYSTGIRRMELLALTVFDVEEDRGAVRVREGKGRYDRVVPIGERALAWYRRYRDEVREDLACGLDQGVLFLTRRGEPFTPGALTLMVRGYVQAAEIPKTGACHLWRHSAASLMLENGADIRFIQEM
ncbi:MAG: tyrosine-type recombinase/integrase, partial [Acidobacteria bacterium]|nr:tyrosine-type recombinase/integrase [Acidobacteriota bacterium]